MTDAELDARICAAHGAGDGAALARLYAHVADLAVSGDEARAAFFLTQAFVFALEAGLPQADAYGARLKALDRHR